MYSLKKSRVNNSLHLCSEEISLVEEWISLDSNSSRVKIHYSTSGISSGSLDIHSKRSDITDVTTHGSDNRVKIHFNCCLESNQIFITFIAGLLSFGRVRCTRVWRHLNADFLSMMSTSYDEQNSEVCKVFYTLIFELFYVAMLAVF